MVEAHCGTGKSFSEALVLTSTNPQYDKDSPVLNRNPLGVEGTFKRGMMF